MHVLKTKELKDADLLAAVKQALSKSYADLSFKIGAMGLAELQAYLDDHLDINLLDGGMDDNAGDLRDAILAHHEPLLPGEDDLQQACDEDLWPLCEHILTNYGYSLGRRAKFDGGRYTLIWWVEVESEMFCLYGDTPREAVLRCYVMDKIGAEVTL